MTSRVITAALAAALTAGSLVAASPASAARTAPPRTQLTLQVTGCEGCEIGLTQALNGRRKVWQAPSRTVEDGSAEWSIPTSRTHGLSITVLAPWDGGGGYVPTVAFRYPGARVGDGVTNRFAKTKKRASACWAGTESGEATLEIKVVHARSTNPPGEPIRTPRAFTSTTQDWEKPMERAFHGISGTQDATYCG